jgi:hypothetical protein
MEGEDDAGIAVQTVTRITNMVLKIVSRLTGVNSK